MPFGASIMRPPLIPEGTEVMNTEDKKKIIELICPLVNKGEAALLLGAGFSLGNVTAASIKIPSGDGLRDMLLEKCGKSAGVKTTLKDAYLYAQRNLPNFSEFLESCFTVNDVYAWQERIFRYVWNRIYTTNIDNVLDIAFNKATRKGILSAEFCFFNYSESQLANNAIGTVPVVTIHGTLKRKTDGFIFSNLEYAHAASKILDWHNELAAKIMVGGLIVIGNQLDEADIDSHLAARLRIYGETTGGQNWIVMPNPDEIKRDNYIAAGFDVIDATAEEFFETIYSSLIPRSIDDIILDTVPASRNARTNVKAMSWFKEAFNSVHYQIERSSKTKGILRHFVSGAHPDWFYITNSAHAQTSRTSELLRTLGEAMKSKGNGVRVINIVGPSGSGKTTAIKASLAELVKSYPYIYEYDSANGIDVDLLYSIVSAFTSKSIIIFYSASEYYYAVNALANRLKDKGTPLCLFVLEDRSNEYRKNFRQLADCKTSSILFEMGQLSLKDATAIAEKIDEHGVNFPKFSELPLEKRARMIIDKERGYGGDLLSALFSLTTHENFEQKIFQDYNSVTGELPRRVLDIAAIMNSLGFGVPINYAAGFLETRVENIVECLSNDLIDIVICNPNSDRLGCRHRVIAEYYFNNCISGHGTVDSVVGILNYLSKQFSVDDIRYHPLAYQMYKKIISFNFLHDQFFPTSTRRADTETTYHEAQKVFGKDGIFWLHFGRFYRKIGELDNAIDCFRTGLIHYESFQTKHSLGTALLDKYIEGKCSDEGIFREGFTLLENERLARGNTDAYPTATLCDQLMHIVSINKNHMDAKNHLKACINYGIEHFRGDEFFERKMKEYIALTR